MTATIEKRPIACDKVRVFPSSRKELLKRARLRGVSTAVIVGELLAK